MASVLFIRANVAPSKLPITMSAVAQASAAMRVVATTVTEAGEVISGPPRAGFVLCDM